jgi:hypothetical protein
MSNVKKTRKHDGRDRRVYNGESLPDFSRAITLGAAQQIKRRLNHRSYKQSRYPERTIFHNPENMLIWDVCSNSDCPDEYRAVIEHFVPHWASADVINQGMFFDGVDKTNPESALNEVMCENCYNVRTYHIKDTFGRTIASISQNSFGPLMPILTFSIEYDDEKRVPMCVKCHDYTVDFYYDDDNKLTMIDEGMREFKYGAGGVWEMGDAQIPDGSEGAAVPFQKGADES